MLWHPLTTWNCTADRSIFLEINRNLKTSRPTSSPYGSYRSNVPRGPIWKAHHWPLGMSALFSSRSSSKYPSVMSSWMVWPADSPTTRNNGRTKRVWQFWPFANRMAAITEISKTPAHLTTRLSSPWNGSLLSSMLLKTHLHGNDVSKEYWIKCFSDAQTSVLPLIAIHTSIEKLKTWKLWGKTSSNYHPACTLFGILGDSKPWL